ncbi:MAG: hypothetical protein ACOC8Q_02565 [Desulfosalsimonas sp.]
MANTFIDLSKNCDPPAPELTSCLRVLNDKTRELNVDIATLLRYYPEAGNHERLYGKHADLIQAADFDFEMAGARMLGRDMAAIMTAQTRETVLKILEVHTNPDGDDRLLLAIARFIPDQDYEKGQGPRAKGPGTRTLCPLPSALGPWPFHLIYP